MCFCVCVFLCFCVCGVCVSVILCLCVCFRVRVCGYFVFCVLHCVFYILELAVLALARIMCANIHSQNGTAILAHVYLDHASEHSERCFFSPSTLCLPQWLVHQWSSTASFLRRLRVRCLCRHHQRFHNGLTWSV